MVGQQTWKESWKHKHFVTRVPWDTWLPRSISRLTQITPSSSHWRIRLRQTKMTNQWKTWSCYCLKHHFLLQALVWKSQEHTPAESTGWSSLVLVSTFIFWLIISDFVFHIYQKYVVASKQEVNELCVVFFQELMRMRPQKRKNLSQKTCHHWREMRMMHHEWKKLINWTVKNKLLRLQVSKMLKAKKHLVHCKHVNPLFHFCFVTCVITGNSSFVNFLICEIKLFKNGYHC